jgi:MFS family permease
MVAASVISLFMPPAIGTLSDRTCGGFGRRRPYIAIGGLLLLMSTPLLVDSSSMVIFLVGLSLLLIGKNVLTPAYQSLVPDHVSEEQRGETAGYVGGMTILGNVVGLGLAAWLLGGVSQHAYNASMIRSNAGIYYAVTAFLVLLGLLITVFGVREIPLLVHKHESAARTQETLHKFAFRFLHDWIDPWRNFNFRMVFLTRASLMLGLALFMTYIEYYFARVQHVANFVQVTGVVAILALGGAVVSGIGHTFGSYQAARSGGMCGYSVHEPGCPGVCDFPKHTYGMALAAGHLLRVGVWCVFKRRLGLVHRCAALHGKSRQGPGRVECLGNAASHSCSHTGQCDYQYGRRGRTDSDRLPTRLWHSFVLLLTRRCWHPLREEVIQLANECVWIKQQEPGCCWHCFSFRKAG